MSEILWLLVSVAGIVALLGAVFVWKLSRKGWKHETDYRAFFYMGVVWFPLGVALDFPVFYILGLAYLVIGLANKDKWGKKQPLTPEQIRWKKIALAVGIAVLVAGVAAFMFFV
jgi:heme/copper-type cytochrome/quinol oxidase subunit 2